MKSLSKSKINKLFKLRLLSEHLNINQVTNIQISDLALIQKRIYELDKYFESNWEIRTDKLSSYWENINASVQDTLIDKKINIYTSQIKEYQSIESRLRQLDSSKELSLLDFYTKKSCDIKLLRKIIQSNSEISNDTILWTFYDLVTEINDDLTDFEEDLTTFNYNKFAVEILFEGKIRTEKKFREFLNSISCSLELFSTSTNPIEKHLYNQTKSILKMNVQLLCKLTKSNLNPESSSLYKALKEKAVDNKVYDVHSY